ncbi:MAG: class C sortase [Oscillospiraceae bacterium]|nr:class C sortase [Oscillospiraceae bacterium]
MKGKWSYIILILVFLVGLSLLLYPTVSDWWNSFHQSRAIMNYTQMVANLDDEEYDRILNSAREYNANVARNGIKWALTDEERTVYDEELNFAKNGNMGYITIPTIEVEIPLYHGTSEVVLQSNIGHLEGTSLPVGGYTSHCVLSGHRGLPSARLFTDLDKMVVGDMFMLNILGETLTYSVDQIRIVEPTDLSDLQLVDGQDLCTLVTCTPYGVNTHRLLVRGHRIDNQEEKQTVRVVADAVQIETMYVAPVVAVPMVLIVIVWLIIDDRIKRKYLR